MTDWFAQALSEIHIIIDFQRHCSEEVSLSDRRGIPRVWACARALDSSVTGYRTITEWASQCPIEALGLTVRSYNSLRNHGVQTVGELLRLGDSELLGFQGFGKKSLRDVHYAVDRFLKSEEAESARLRDPLLPERAAEAATPRYNFDRLHAAPASDPVSAGGWLIPQIIKGDLDYPLESLDLSVRTRNVIIQLNITSVRELLNYPKSDLPEARNFGRKSMAELEAKVFEFLSAGAERVSGLQVGTKAFVDQMLSRLRQDRAGIVADRHGLWDGITETLQDIGDKHGLTRERIRQIEAKGLQRLRRLFAEYEVRVLVCTKIRAGVALELGDRFGLFSEDDLIKVLADDCTLDEANLAIRFLEMVYCSGGNIFSGFLSQVEEDVYGVDSFLAEDYTKVLELIKQIFEEEKRPFTEQKLCAEVAVRSTAASLPWPHAFVQRVLTLSPSVSRLPNGTILLSSWFAFRRHNLVRMAEVALSALGRPAHISEIKQKILAMDTERTEFNEIGLRSRLSDRRDKFVWVKNSTYGLKAWGLEQPPYIKDRLVQLLSEVKYPLSYWYLKEKVLEVCNCKEQSVRMTLDLNPRVFKKFDNDQYGLCRHY